MADSIVPFVRGMKVGLGYDRLTSEPMVSPALAGSSITAIGGAGGQSVTSDCLIIEDVATLHKAVGVTADASGSYSGFSASAGRLPQLFRFFEFFDLRGGKSQRQERL